MHTFFIMVRGTVGEGAGRIFTELEERVVIKAVALPFPGQVILLTSEHSTDVHRKDVRITESKLLQGELRPKQERNHN